MRQSDKDIEDYSELKDFTFIATGEVKRGSVICNNIEGKLANQDFWKCQQIV